MALLSMMMKLMVAMVVPRWLQSAPEIESYVESLQSTLG
jgi:hypothetical protein